MSAELKLHSQPYPHHDETNFQKHGSAKAYSHDTVAFLLYRTILRQHCTLKFTIGHYTHIFHPQASEILPGLYISDIYTATSPQLIDELGISHILSIHTKFFNFGRRFKSLWIGPSDTEKDPDALLRILPHTTSFLGKAMDEERHSRALVCCVNGLMDSPAIVIGYLIARHRMSYESALEHVQLRRHVTRIDMNTRRQLLDWQKRQQRRLETALELRLS